MSNAGTKWVFQWNETARVFEKEERVFEKEERVFEKEECVFEEEERLEREMHFLYYEVRREGVKSVNHLVLLQIIMM